MGDDAGLVAKLDLTLFLDAQVEFDWRTFLADTSDRFVVMYYIGDDLDGTDANYDWFNDPLLGNGQMAAAPCPDASQCNPWVAANWTELLRASKDDSWNTDTFALPVGDVLYLAFWMDNGDSDFAKIDNILVTGTIIPEPSTALLVGVGLIGLAAHRTRRVV